jgi:hypothetical protein
MIMIELSISGETLLQSVTLLRKSSVAQEIPQICEYLIA